MLSNENMLMPWVLKACHKGLFKFVASSSMLILLHILCPVRKHANAMGFWKLVVRALYVGGVGPQTV
jgi:hypothetical protein